MVLKKIIWFVHDRFIYKVLLYKPSYEETKDHETQSSRQARPQVQQGVDSS
jgi:hypothetical protein